MEKRRLKVMFQKAGGNAGKNSYNTRMSIPKEWLNRMDITIDERAVDVYFDGEKIIIEKSVDKEEWSFYDEI